MRAIEREHAKGSRRWPSIQVGVDEFDRFAKEKPAAAVEAYGDELFLACALAKNDRAAMKVFEREYLSKVGEYVARTDPSPAFADEVRQLLRMKLLVGELGSAPKIGEYSGSGPLGAWLRVAAARAAMNLKRGKKNGATITEEMEVQGAAPDPELDYLKSKYGQQFREAFRHVLNSLDPQKKSLLSLYYLEGMSSPSIAVAYKVHPATVRKWLDAAREQIVEQTHARLKSQLDLSSAELKSLMKVLHSQLEQSLSRFLK
ncbi:MAG: sigma-70 family RNA polymerase sigma factor [Myxococcaceae bacterium]